MKSNLEWRGRRGGGNLTLGFRVALSCLFMELP